MAVHEWNGVIRLDRGQLDRGRLDRGRRRGVGRIWDLLRLAWQARRTRRQLAEMDDRMLADIGIGRAQAYEEARRAPWDTGPRRAEAGASGQPHSAFTVPRRTGRGATVSDLASARGSGPGRPNNQPWP